MRHLVIVESPNKVKKISGYLGSDYQVMASFGHIRDLPRDRGLAVSFDNGRVTPHYEITAKEGVVPRLKQAAKDADVILLATDPDREGEAISWHLTQVLGKHQYRRVTFHAITKEAVTKAVSNPRDIDLNMVSAQQARRVLDRVVGFVVSPTCASGAGDPKARSAGRVQSVALRLVVEREIEISGFNTKEFFILRAKLEKPGAQPSFWSRLIKIGDKDVPRGLGDPQQAASLLDACHKANDWTVSASSTTTQQRHAQAPFTTATCQQDASVKLALNPDETMSLLQELFEGGHITYHRTDSVALAPEAITMARSIIQSQLPADYLPDQVQQHASKAANAQEAHEAIRPTHPESGPDAIGSGKSGELYRLIWRRYIASQMAPSAAEATVIDVTVAGGRATFRAKGTKQIFDGWKRIYADDNEDLPTETKGKDTGSDDADGGDVVLPAVTVGDKLACTDRDVAKGKTKPPPRYTQASLIKKLDHDGIGRPSTYAAIMGKIIGCRYVEEKGRKLYATKTGIALIEFLKRCYVANFIEPDFTAQMELQLDRIARGEVTWEPEITRASHEILSLAQKCGLKYNPLAGESIDRSPKEIPKDTAPRPCRDCKENIYWIQDNGRWLPPLNKDGSRHQCACAKKPRRKSK